MIPDPPTLKANYSVPDLQLNWFVFDSDGFGTKFNADGGLMFETKSAINELKKEATFADTFI